MNFLSTNVFRRSATHRIAKQRSGIQHRDARRNRIDGDTVLDVLNTGSTFLAALSNGAVAVPGLQAAATVAKEVIAIAQVCLVTVPCYCRELR